MYYRRIFALVVIVLMSVACGTHHAPEPEPVETASPDAADDTLLVEAACGQCQFGLTGHACDLAVRIDGESYFVDGTAIDEHGDAHGEDGFCNAVRQARVTGEVVDGRFVATSFELVEAPVTN